MASCAERGLSALDREICGLQVEMRSEKLTTRHKAFSRMVTILSNQEDVFIEYMDSSTFSTGWGDIFDAVYQGILVQSASSAATAKGKNNDYFVVLLKLAELAMDRDEPRLEYSRLIGASVSALKGPSVRSTFGVPFLQVLNKYVLSSKWDLTPVSYEEWKEILECSFEVMDENQIARQVAVACLSSSVRKFLENCSSSSLLVEYLPNLMNYVRQTEKGKVLHELMRVACHTVQDLAVDCRTEVIKFLDSFLPYTIQAYEAKMDAEQKSVLFRLMHLSLIILYPDGKPLSAAERLAKDVALSSGVDEAAHKKSLRQFYYIVKCELKANHTTSYSAGGGARESKFTDGFIDFAARLCFTIHWNEGILEDGNGEGSASKKVKLSSKLQSLIDLVVNESNHHDWRWFVITSHVMDRHHGALQGEDYPTVLQLLCDIQPSLQMSEQQQAFYRCSRVLLEFEQTDAFRSLLGSVIDEAYCRERWTKITTTTFRGCTSTAAKESAENNTLLQLLIKHRKYPSISFLSGTVLKAFYTHAIKKTNVNVATVQVILETLASVECLGSVDEVLDALFNYLFPQTRESQAKEILHSKERLDAKLLAKISVLAVVAKHSATENDDAKNEGKQSKRVQKNRASFDEQEDRLKSLEQSLLWQNVDELVTMEEVDICQNIESKPPPEVTYNVNEALFEKLCKAINFEKHTLPDNNGMLAMALVNLCYDMELYLEILNVLLAHGAYDEAQCDKCLLAKKVQFKFQEIVLGLERLLENVVSLSNSELTEIGNRLLAIFRGPHHASVRKILQKLNASVVLRWTMAQIDNTAGDESMFAEVINPENLSNEQRTKRCFLHIIAHYLQYDGVSLEEAYDLLDSIELNIDSNVDLFCVFDLCRILLRQPSQEFIADWVSRQFIAVCKRHHTSVAVTEVIIALYADLVMFVSPFEDMEKIVSTILYSFTKKCANRTYSADLQAKIVAQIKFLLKAFPQYFESNLHQKVYAVLVPLLGNPSYRIKMEATRTLLHFLQPEWAYREEALVPRNYYDFQSALYGKVHDELRLLLEQDVPRFGDEAVTVSKPIYAKALEHLKECISDSTGPKYSLPSCLCLKSSAQIERTLMEVKRWLWDTDERQQKMVHLFHYTVLFEDLQQYFMQQGETSFKPYLVRDVVYFLCNLLNTLPALRLATLNSLGRFPHHQIKLHYLPIAEASKYCQAHFKAILYGELWYNAEIAATNSKAPTGTIKATAKRSLASIMKFCHQAIGVYDAVKAFLDPILERTEYYSLQQNHAASLLSLDASFSFWPSGLADANVAESLAHATKKCSLYGVARSLNAPGKVDYECLWRLGDWSVAIDAERMDAGKSVGQNALTINAELFERAHYKALKCLELKDDLAVESAISEGRHAIVEMFKLTSTESTKHIYHGLCRLRQLQQIEDFADIQFFRKIDCEQDLLSQWDAQDKLPYSEFGLMERLLSQRLCIFNTARVRAKRKWVPQAIYNTLLLLIHESRLGGYHDSALRNIRIATGFELPPNVKALVQLEDAQLNWSLGDRKLACELALEVMENQRYNDLMVNATACRVYGEFMAESHTKEVHTLYQDYFQQSEQCVTQALAKRKTAADAIAIDHRCFDSERNFTVLYTVAKYADRELGRLDKFLHSKDWELRQQNIAKMKAEIERLKQEGVGAGEQRRKEISRQYTFTQKNMLRAQKATDTVKTERLNYLQLALANYILFAKEDTITSDTVIFRILALWLNNQHVVQIQEILAESIDQIPSHKFIAVLPQLTARLNVTGSVGKLINDILLRCGTDHPHHTLPFVFAQLYAFKDLSPNEVPENDGRLLGAKALYEKLKNVPSIEHTVGQMNRMNLALIELANKSISKNPSFQEYTMTERDPLRRLTNLDRIHCPTIELPVNKSGSYKDLVKGVLKWDPKVVGVGGINAPKKLKCRCTDGVERTQLLKGKDDMRQDAVMQQVFGILNILLRNDKETANRNLSIRTYKVVPLSRQSGILEWCNDTVPIGVWLTQGHEKYRPEDYKPSVARKKFSNNAQPGMTVDKKLQNYLDICRKLQPVFRYYFLEHYLEPGKWFERRQNYTKSVATSSMIGHILGIGDRHVQNILIDKRTAEVIHIDFGIAFEMGKNLPTSETIPFRLTRDIVDGMGMSGVEGVFKKSCEKTMEVLRNNQAPILTILEVLLYDPLYSWNVLANKKANQQQISEELRDSPDAGKEDLGYAEMTINVTAEHALMQVKKKLDGKEDDKFMSVEGQVQKLIFSATNERNLCQLFHGWQPYL
ncbi:hypothetical protein ZHAS_00012124 [Anopheles sinensis]|uniref:Serine/threonine-protein kinase ATM n=1 Tax=Anopheles sinensis TaxID=74873 RepID=A0A084W1Y7_ANOSI|nr:hypothetical protein ZHAS_00012124 [Anopheles sinensis]